MKKLMLAVVALASGVAMAIESANVVGYQNKALNAQANSFVTMTFLPTGTSKENITLSSFQPKGGEDGWEYSKDYLATIKVNGSFDKKYGYVSAYWAGEEGFDDASLEGWWDLDACKADFEVDELVSRNNVVIPFGTGVAIYTSMSDITVTFSGEVLSEDYGVPLNPQANTFTGLYAPKTMTLGELVPTGGEDGWEYSKDYLATLKVNGSFDKKYGYVSPYWAGEEGFDDTSLEGWWDLDVCKADFDVDEFESRNTVEIDAGQAFAVYTSMSGIELVIPSALP
jgi:hypothetical protein